jgi:CheY-like chemotaxis protein
MLRVANEAGIGLSKNLNDLLDISKIDAGQLDFQPTRFSPYHLIQSTVSLLRESAHQKGLTLDVSSGDALVPELFLVADALRIQQVLVNILGNAIKFSESGKVTIHGDVSGSDGPVQFSIDVGDTGVGIDPDIAERLFDPFVQGQNYGPGHRAGLGLGLSICKKIVDAMGGAISVSPNTPRGTRVRVVVPCAPGPGNVEVKADESKVAMGDALRILIVDDNPVNALIAVALVEKMGHVGTSVNSGEAAISAVAIGNLDLVLMDILMPGIDGIEAARRIRQLPAPVGRTPIIAITASPTEDIKQACEAAGIQSVQSKPFQVVELSAAIQQFGRPVIQA